MIGLKRSKFVGIITIIILGFLLHYVFVWTGHSTLAGLFVPVNESVWEHLKLGYWSVVLFSVVEYFQLKPKMNNYWLAKLMGVLTLELTIVVIFYSYTFVAGKDIFLIDIFSYIIATIACQYVTYSVLRLTPFLKPINRISFVLLIALGVLFGVTTFYPLRNTMFKDNNSNTYGINKEK